MQNTRRELADAKAENDALRDDAAAGRRRLHIKAVCQSVREAKLPPPAWIMQPPDWQTPSRLFHPQREADHYGKKQLEGTQKYINEQCRWSCPYRWATHVIIVSNTHALPAEYKCLK